MRLVGLLAAAPAGVVLVELELTLSHQREEAPLGARGEVGLGVGQGEHLGDDGQRALGVKAVGTQIGRTIARVGIVDPVLGGVFAIGLV